MYNQQGAKSIIPGGLSPHRHFPRTADVSGQHEVDYNRRRISMPSSSNTSGSASSTGKKQTGRPINSAANDPQGNVDDENIMDEFEYYCQLANSPSRSPRSSLANNSPNIFLTQTNPETGGMGAINASHYQRPRSQSLFPPVPAYFAVNQSPVQDHVGNQWPPTKRKSEFRTRSVKEHRKVSMPTGDILLTLPKVISHRSNSPRLSVTSSSPQGNYTVSAIEEAACPESGLSSTFLENEECDDEEQQVQCFVRNFRITDKGHIVSTGDSVCSVGEHSIPSSHSSRRCSVNNIPVEENVSSNLSTASPVNRNPYRRRGDSIQVGASNSAPAVPYFTVQIAGAPGVGKSSLLRQLLTSAYIGTNQKDDEEDLSERFVSVIVDKKECLMKFLDVTALDEEAESNEDCAMDAIFSENSDAYVLVYSIDDYASFTFAKRLLQELYTEAKRSSIMFLVANKSDLERSRQVTKEEARTVAKIHACHYIEISTALNHRVNELLVSVATNMQLKRQQMKVGSTGENEEQTISRGASLKHKSPASKFTRFFTKRFSSKSSDEISCKFCDK